MKFFYFFPLHRYGLRTSDCRVSGISPFKAPPLFFLYAIKIFLSVAIISLFLGIIFYKITSWSKKGELFLPIVCYKNNWFYHGDVENKFNLLLLAHWMDRVADINTKIKSIALWIMFFLSSVFSLLKIEFFSLQF